MPAVRVHSDVALEFSEARFWYAARSDTAALSFAHRFDFALRQVIAHPRALAPWRSVFRRVRLVRFPYLLIFHTDRKFTSILALVHQRREPSDVLTGVHQRLNRFE